MTRLLPAILLAGCCTLRPGSVQCDEALYGKGWTHQGPKARCADELLDVANSTATYNLRPLHGVIVWKERPFECGVGQWVWGCAPSIERSYVTAIVVTAAHASDTALAEEIAHWVWYHYKPGVLTEEWRSGVYWRDPEFKAWYEQVQRETREICP